MGLECVQLKIEGQVQGVCYRSFVCDKARQLQLKGFVRNCSNGTVELVAEGEALHLNELIDWCRKGPPHAVVTNVRVQYKSVSSLYQGFEISC